MLILENALQASVPKLTGPQHISTVIIQFENVFRQNSNPCTGSSILGSLILGYSV